MDWFANCSHQKAEHGGEHDQQQIAQAFSDSLYGFHGTAVLRPRKRVGMVSAKKLQFISLMVVALLFGSNAQAQSGDWQAVQNLKPGSYILVKAQHRYRCSVEAATNEGLICQGHLPRSLRVSTLIISRSEIRELRMLPHPNQAKDALIGAGIGAGAAALVAGTGSRSYAGVNAFFGGLNGAAGGALVGGMVPIFQVIFQRGKLIYKQ